MSKYNAIKTCIKQQLSFFHVRKINLALLYQKCTRCKILKFREPVLGNPEPSFDLIKEGAETRRGLPKS